MKLHEWGGVGDTPKRVLEFEAQHSGYKQIPKPNPDSVTC